MTSSDGDCEFELEFENLSMSVNPTLKLPISLSPPDFPTAVFSAYRSEPGLDWLTMRMMSYAGRITFLTPIPEPRALALPALVAIGIGVRRARRQRAGRALSRNVSK